MSRQVIAVEIALGRSPAIRRNFLQPQRPRPRLVAGWGAGRRRRISGAADAAEIIPTEPGRLRPAKGVQISGTTFPFRPKTVVIGAGVIGLSIAWRLAKAGCRVCVY